MPGIGYLAALVMMIFTAVTSASMGAAILSGDWQAVEAFALLSIAYAALAYFTFQIAPARTKNTNTAGVFSAAIIIWLTLVVAAMPAFMILEDANLALAFFEAASAATTLGSSLTAISEMSMSMIVYRSATAWSGGLLTLMLAVYVLGRYAVGGTPNRDLRFVLHGVGHGDQRLFQTFVEVGVPYGALTLIAAALLALTRVEPAHALIGALNIMSTNGFVGWQTAGSLFNNRVAEILAMVFMMIAASSIIWQKALVANRMRQTRDQGETGEFWVFALAAIAVGIVFSVTVYPISGSFGDAVLNRGFDIVSILTTTGITNNIYSGISVPIIFVLALALIGGNSYSTAGGLKFFRLRSMMRHSRNEILRLVYPNQILPGSVDASSANFEQAKATWSAFISTLIFILMVTIVFASLGHNFIAALNLSVGSFSSVGNLVSNNLFVSGGEEVSVFTLLTVGFTAMAGRVELLVILAAISRNRW
ncbi:hypothetical protein MNBD_ALPHA12-509 [hydrothermal vent metagenome]|uniref:Trk potassium uptake system protein TrkH n=1 Tax=hydrothermal vent metagenome TaxID=652676 RepID=A0A3B0TC46_9ZZZZ